MYVLFWVGDPYSPLKTDKRTDREYHWRLEYSKMYKTIQNTIFGFILRLQNHE